MGNSKLADVIEKIMAKLHFETQPVHIRSTRDIDTDHGEMIKISADNASFKINIIDSGSKLNMKWFFLGQNGHAAISFFLCGIPIGIVSQFRQNSNLI